MESLVRKFWFKVNDCLQAEDKMEPEDGANPSKDQLQTFAVSVDSGVFNLNEMQF